MRNFVGGEKKLVLWDEWMTQRPAPAACLAEKADHAFQRDIRCPNPDEVAAAVVDRPGGAACMGRWGLAKYVLWGESIAAHSSACAHTNPRVNATLIYNKAEKSKKRRV